MPIPDRSKGCRGVQAAGYPPQRPRQGYRMKVRCTVPAYSGIPTRHFPPANEYSLFHSAATVPEADHSASRFQPVPKLPHHSGCVPVGLQPWTRFQLSFSITTRQKYCSVVRHTSLSDKFRCRRFTSTPTLASWFPFTICPPVNNGREAPTAPCYSVLQHGHIHVRSQTHLHQSFISHETGSSRTHAREIIGKSLFLSCLAISSSLFAFFIRTLFVKAA